MKFKALLAMLLAAALFSCGGDKPHYQYPDDDPKPDKDSVEPDGDTGDTATPDGDSGDTATPDGDSGDTSTQDGDTGDTATPDGDTGDTATPDGDTGDTATPDGDTGDTATPDDDTTPVQYICGDGFKTPDEQCDNGENNTDGPGIPGETCRTDCRFARCGDGTKDDGELCDDGNNSSNDYCSPDCKSVTGRCGDGIMQSNEVCEKSQDPYCADDCQSRTGYCGDGIKQVNEVCDTGLVGSYCRSDCQKLLGYCNDGIIQRESCECTADDVAAGLCTTAGETIEGCASGFTGINELCDDGELNGTYGKHCDATCNGWTGYCGDGIKNGSEVCDDGNNEDNDYCSSDCMTKNGSCGDGIIQEFEECDRAPFGDGIGEYCSTDCKTVLGSCGDGIVQPNEECDKGLAGNGKCDYGDLECAICTTGCKNGYGTATFCGDGIQQPNEQCDTQGTGPYDGPYCASDCQSYIGWCGDGKKQPFEACDKATANEGIGPIYCAADCKSIIAWCGDGRQQANERCDNGDNNDNYNCPYNLNPTPCTVCINNCQGTASGHMSFCGDGIKNGNEVCDSAGHNGEYGFCNSDCSARIGCGDGVIDSAHGETCDEGATNGQYGHCNLTCDGTVGCGDGIKNGEEACDDGSELNGTYNHCNASCTGLGEHCGDGIENGDEQCDEGENNGNLKCEYGLHECTVCTNECTKQAGETAYCGDDVKNGPEYCDDGVRNGSYSILSPGYCNEDCTAMYGFCGDGSVQNEEQCDHNGSPTTSCQYGEHECTVCNIYCKSIAGQTSYCGDGRKDALNGEACDFGGANTDSTDCTYGSESCTLCSTSCTEVTGAPHLCGDGTLDEPNEECDWGSPMNGQTDCQYGEHECTLCSATCRNVSGATSFCGDGRKDTLNGEACDDGTGINGTYSLAGTCNEDCHGRGAGGYCGDGIKNGSETCDEGSEINGTYNHCNSTCSGIGTFCGDGIINGNEACDDGRDLNGSYGHCNESCTGKSSYCGDGNIDTANGEVCDDGTGINGTYSLTGTCNSDCHGTGAGGYCGDGRRTNGEECDNAEANTNEALCAYPSEHACQLCDQSCRIITGAPRWCGDGTVDEGYEQCDDSTSNGTYNNCDSNCQGITGTCGDNIVQNSNCEGIYPCTTLVGANEKCDEGRDTNGQYEHCKDDCSGPGPHCGDGVVDSQFGEVCDEGEFFNGLEGHCDLGCRSICGDGIVQLDEACDEGRDVNGTYGHCDSKCSAILRCGDGIVTSPEVCDDRDGVNGTYNHCNAECTGRIECGDGVVDTANGEICDDGGNNGSAGFCYGDCSGNCGDNTIQSEDCTCTIERINIGLCEYENMGQAIDNCVETRFAHELCDNGGNNGSAGFCNLTCNDNTAVCGNGHVELGEACDEGPELNGTVGHCNDSCSATIPIPLCGNGHLDNESCICTQEMIDAGSCNELNSEIDGCKENEGTHEICDHGIEHNGTYGYCNAECTGIIRCGDGIVNGSEICDEGSALNGTDGHCRADCTGFCGDGIIQNASCLCSQEMIDAGFCTTLNSPVANCVEVENTNELCDDGADNDKNGYCNRRCEAVATCGDGKVNKEEFCDGDIIPCSYIAQFASDAEHFASCTADCRNFDFSQCVYDSSYVNPVFSTGTSKCYDNSAEISCSDTTSPFYGQEPNFSFTPLGIQAPETNTVLVESVLPDTGWIWIRNAGSSVMDFAAAKSYCEETLNGLAYEGRTNWRLPTARELVSIISIPNGGYFGTSAFDAVSPDLFWTSEGIVAGPAHLYSDQIIARNADSADEYQVRCVSDVTDSSGHTPKDHCASCVTPKVMFSSCSSCGTPEAPVSDFIYALLNAGENSDTSFNALIFRTNNELKSWEDAFAVCRTIGNDTGANNMRMPTVNELALLLDLDSTAGKTIADIYLGNRTFWSVSTRADTPAKAYVLNAADGTISTLDKSSSAYVICVE